MNYLNHFAAGMAMSSQMLAYRARYDAETRAQQHLYEKSQLMYASYLAAPAKKAKCPGCGSHEWRQHKGVRICAYCRCGQ